MNAPTKILILSHGHPDLSPGGAEHAARLMFQEFKRRPDWQPLFLAAYGGREAARDTTPFSSFSEDGSEILFKTSCDSFRFRQDHPKRLEHHLAELLNWFRPDVVHVHHYVSFGIEVLRAIRNWSTRVPLAVTLHEYLAICHHNGQMVRTAGLELCERASPAACARCFPERAPQDFLLRELYLKSMFECVDLFFCPSDFLRRRYIEWGLPEEKMITLENGQDSGAKLHPRATPTPDLRDRFCYLGQMNPYKGLDVLLEAAKHIAKNDPELAKRISIAVYGWNLAIQPQEYQTRIRRLLRDTSDMVVFCGSYRREQLESILKGWDWIVIPSVWWENSPLVIQEAYKYGRPVIASDLGGMREKIAHRQTGLLFQPGSSLDLADCLTMAASEQGLWDRLYERLPEPQTAAAWIDTQAALYDRIRTRRENGESNQHERSELPEGSGVARDTSLSATRG